MDIQLIHYFMAHAPASPASWFEPVMPPKPPQILTGEDGTVYATHREAEAAVGDAYCDTNTSARAEWDRLYDREESVQWPHAWARLQIEVLRRAERGEL